ncbi:MAG: DUF2189 domain-containing protein [Hyphomonadaceae bacterium]
MEETRTAPPPGSLGLPDVADIGMSAPFRWLALGWRDFMRAPGPCLVYGLCLVVVSGLFVWALMAAGFAVWVLVLSCGFVFVAPMLAMGLYEAGRALDAGERPRLTRMFLVSSAIRRDVAFLGLALMLLYLFWGRIAQLVYGLSTNRAHRTFNDVLEWALNTPGGHGMLIAGTILGGVIAFLTYCLVVVSAPMLLDRRNDIFIATVTSVRSVNRNFAPMLVWAGLVAAITLMSMLCGLLPLAIAFPWLGLASWRAFRELVPGLAPPEPGKG